MRNVDSIKDLPNLLYHGTISIYSDSIKSGIKLNCGLVPSDFGNGFYTTTFKKQAEIFAEKKVKIHNRKNKNNIADPIVAVFDLNQNILNECSGIIFNTENYKWKEFIFNNRVGKELAISDFHNLDSVCDFVYGSVADSLIAQMIESYCTGHINAELFLKQLNPLNNGESDQLSFHTIDSLKSIKLKYIYTVKNEEKIVCPI